MSSLWGMALGHFAITLVLLRELDMYRSRKDETANTGTDVPDVYHVRATIGFITRDYEV